MREIGAYVFITLMLVGVYYIPELIFAIYEALRRRP
jgi:hypothetical protein